MGKADGNLHPCTDEILHTHPHSSKEGFGEVLTPGPKFPFALGGLKP